MNRLKQTLFFLTVLFVLSSSYNTISAQDNSSSTFTPSGKFTGQLFLDYYWKVHSDTLNRGTTYYANQPKGSNAFDPRRVYLGYDYQFSPKISASFLAAYESNFDAQGDRTLYVKYANLKIKDIYKNADLVLGAQATPTFSFIEEQAWGYRSIEKTETDMRGLGKSNDVGISLLGHFDDAGNFGYNLMIGNGTGQKPETNIFKKFYGEVYGKFANQKIVVDLTGDYERTQLWFNDDMSHTTFKGFVAYQSTPITIGVSYVTQWQQNGAVATNASKVNDTATLMPQGISAFIHGQIVPNKLNFFARFDTYTPDVNYINTDTYNKGYLGGLEEDFITAGLDYTPLKNVHFMPNVWIDTYHSQAANVTGSIENDEDIVARLTLFYKF
jgi:hypothetical protein